MSGAVRRFLGWLTRDPDDTTDRALNAVKRLAAVLGLVAVSLAAVGGAAVLLRETLQENPDERLLDSSSPSAPKFAVTAATSLNSDSLEMGSDPDIIPIQCAPSDDLVVVQGGLSVWNVEQDDEYSERTFAAPGDIVRLEIWVFNRNPNQDVFDPVAQFLLGDQPAAGISIQGRVCAANTALLSSGATIVGVEGPIAAEFIPGSVKIQGFIDGEYRIRPGSDSAFKAGGESLGRIPATEDPDKAHSSIIAEVRIVAG